MLEPDPFRKLVRHRKSWDPGAVSQANPSVQANASRQSFHDSLSECAYPCARACAYAQSYVRVNKCMRVCPHVWACSQMQLHACMPRRALAQEAQCQSS